MMLDRPPARSRWTWLVSWATSAAILALLVAMPAAWWDAIWPDGVLRDHDQARRPARELALVEVEILRPRPPLRIEPESRPRPRRDPLPPDPAWWTQGWNRRIASDFSAPPTVVPDSLVPRPLIDLWGAQATVDLILAAPDSAVQARLWQLVEEEQLARDDLSGLFSAIAKARSFVDLKRREAAMYGEFGPEIVRVPE
jgi:hypothetical protein